MENVPSLWTKTKHVFYPWHQEWCEMSHSGPNFCGVFKQIAYFKHAEVDMTMILSYQCIFSIVFRIVLKKPLSILIIPVWSVYMICLYQYDYMVCFLPCQNLSISTTTDIVVVKGVKLG